MRRWLYFAAGAGFVFGLYQLRKLSCNRLPGGKGDGRAFSEFDARQLERGIAVELEHTRDWRLAREIAVDHLTEDPAYYDKLTAAGL